MGHILPPKDTDPYSIAEFIEATMLQSEETYFSVSEIRSGFLAGQQPTDTEISFGILEIEHRHSIMGLKYPFSSDGRGVARVVTPGTEIYDFLLLMSLKDTPIRQDADYQRSDRLFDAIVREAFRAKLGKGAIVFDFGWPPRGGRPADFSEAVTWAGKQLGVGDRDLDRPENYKDGGVDVIATGPFQDGRPGGSTVYLIQNTVKQDYIKKPRDVDPSRWKDWLRFPIAPSIGFAIPFTVPENDDRWLEITATSHMTMERFRLTLELGPVDVTEWAEYEDIVEFNSTEKKNIDDLEDDRKQPVIVRPRKVRKPEHRDSGVR